VFRVSPVITAQSVAPEPAAATVPRNRRASQVTIVSRDEFLNELRGALSEAPATEVLTSDPPRIPEIVSQQPNSEEPDDGDVPVDVCDWSGFCCHPTERDALFWCSGARSAVGRYNVTSGVATTLVTDCRIPTEAVAVGNWVVFLEKGGIWRGDGRIRFIHTSDEMPCEAEVLCDGETVRPL
jgi:hypothetical protein